MELLVLDTEFREIALVDTFVSLIWTDRYYSSGDFELYTYANSETFSIFQKGFYVYFKDSEHLMIIDQVEIKTDPENGNRLIITGASLEQLLDRRIVWNETELTGNLQNGIKKLINENIISPSLAERAIPNFIFEDSTDPIIANITIDSEDPLQYNGEDLYEVISKLCESYEIGFKITLNSQNQFVFSLYAGADRSYDQTTNPYVLFSPKFENIINSDYIDSTKSYKNVVLVVGGENEGSRPKETVGNALGIERREVKVDAGDISWHDDGGETISEAKYRRMLRQRGEESLLDYIPQVVVDGEVETTKLFKFGNDFFMGDIVQVENEYGVMYTTRITEMIYSQDESGYSNYPSFTIVGDNSDSVQFAYGHMDINGGREVHINIGFRPALLGVVMGKEIGRKTYWYDARLSQSIFSYADTSTVLSHKTIGSNEANTIARIGSDIVTIADPGGDDNLWWYALSDKATESDRYLFGAEEGTGSTITIDCGFKPHAFSVICDETSAIAYTADRAPSGCISASSAAVAAHSSVQVSDTGFSFASVRGKTYYWFAIAENT